MNDGRAMPVVSGCGWREVRILAGDAARHAAMRPEAVAAVDRPCSQAEEGRVGDGRRAVASAPRAAYLALACRPRRAVLLLAARLFSRR